MSDAPLLKLPVELLLKITQYLSIEDAAHFSITCKTSRDDLYKNSSYWRAVALTQCWPQSAGEDGVERDNIADTDDLQNVIKLQKSTEGAFNSVKTWYDLVRLRRKLDLNWKYERFTISDPFRDQDGTWRFKLDPLAHTILWSRFDLSQPLRVCAANDGTMSTKWHFSDWRNERWPWHVEASNGYVCHTFDESLIVWRRSDIPSLITANSSLPSFAGFSPQDSIDEAEEPSDKEAPYQLHLCYSFPTRISCYKARYPYLVAGSAGASRIYLLDMVKGELALHFTTPQQGSMFYIELSEHLIYVAYRTAIHCFDIKTGEILSCLPPIEPRNSPPQFRVDTSYLWNAVHHDSRGNLVAISHTGALLWCRDIRLLSSNDSSAILNSVSHLYLGVSLTQLAVENGHCAFVSERNGLQSLWFMSFREDDKGKKGERQPQIQLIVPALSSDAVISRLEMDSTSIYITGNLRTGEHLPHPSTIRRGIARHYTKHALQWRDGNGVEIGNAWIKAPDIAQEPVEGQEDNEGRSWYTLRDNPSDRIWRLSFTCKDDGQGMEC